MSTRYDNERGYGRYGDRGEDRMGARDTGDYSGGRYDREGDYGGYRGGNRQDFGDYGRGRGASFRGDYSSGGYGSEEYGGRGFGGGRDHESGGERYSGGRPGRGYDRGYGFGGGSNYGRSESGYGGRGRDERDWMDRASDEVASWFGDDEAERRRRMDERRSGEHRGRGPRGYKRSDERIREDVNDRLTDHDYLDASDIEVKVEGGEVTLTGTVESRWAKRRAEDIAEDVSGVTHVQNNLRVNQSRMSTGTSMTGTGTTTATTESETTAAGRTKAKTA